MWYGDFYTHLGFMRIIWITGIEEKHGLKARTHGGIPVIIFIPNNPSFYKLTSEAL
jgi:hypothetical protein